MGRGAKPKVYPPETVATVARLYAANHTQAEIAAEIGTSQKVVWNLMRRSGVPARTAAKRDQWGDKNHQWAGDEAGKQAMHRRLYSRFGKPCKCSQCGTEEAQHYDYANLTGRYEDLEDYAPMCRSCHWKYDDKISNIKHMRQEVK